MATPTTSLAVLALVLVPVGAYAIEYEGPQFSYYDVSGNPKQIAEEMRSNGRNGHYAHTDYHIDYRFRSTRSPQGCAVTWTEVRLRVAIRLPRLVEGDADVRRRWSTFEPALRHHELGHEAIALAAAHEIESALLRVHGQPSCPVADSLATARANDILADLRTRDESYDRETNHGRTQGAIFP